MTGKDVDEFGHDKVPEGVRSWYLTVGEKEYWLSREDGAKILQLTRFNPRGFNHTLEFVPLDGGLPVVLFLTPNDSFTLTASGDD